MNRNHLKIIACVSMLCDHMGYLLFPQAFWLRWIGRLALPLFAFFIGEGCRHTHDRRKYVLQITALAAVCLVVCFAQNVRVTEPWDNPAQRRKLRARNRHFRRTACGAMAVGS